MAFTSAEASAIRFVLGYPDIQRYRDTRLEAAIELVGNDADASARVRAQLTEIGTLNGSNYFSNLLLIAGLKQADKGDAEWFPGMKNGASAPMAAVAMRGRMLCGQVSITLGVPIWSDIWSTEGYAGDEFMSGPNQYGRGGFFPLG